MFVSLDNIVFNHLKSVFPFPKKNVNLNLRCWRQYIRKDSNQGLSKYAFYLYFVSTVRYLNKVHLLKYLTLLCPCVYLHLKKIQIQVYEYYKQCGIVNVKEKLSCFQKHSIAHLNFPLVQDLWNNTKVYDDCDYANNTFHHSGHKAFHGAVIKSQMEVLCSHWCVQPWGQR